MVMKTIMLICAAGMSTSLLVTKMEKAAQERGIEADIFAVSAMEADEIFAQKKIDALLLGPQVRFMLNEFQEKLRAQEVPVEVIPMVDYGMMNGEKVLELAEKLMK